jgi:hypothetical protein
MVLCKLLLSFEHIVLFPILPGVTALSFPPFCLQLGYLSPPVSVYLLFFAGAAYCLCAVRETVKISLSFVPYKLGGTAV